MKRSSNQIKQELNEHIRSLLACNRCPKMIGSAVTGGAVVSKVLLVGQAPGVKEPILKRPFAWTAGKTMFGWFEKFCGLSEEEFRAKIYMAAVCRCFPGKSATGGGDRVPEAGEIEECSRWLKREMEILEPKLVIAVGKLAIRQFLEFNRLTEVIGKEMKAEYRGHSFKLIPLPHPSGASPWHRTEPGKTLLQQALRQIDKEFVALKIR